MSLPEQLHFLRPEAFYAFIPLLLFLMLYLTSKASSAGWKSVCDKQLLPHVLTAGGKKSSVLPMLLILLATSIAITALAGPVWKKLPQPVFTEESALVIALDLSRSMHAADVRPSRLARSRLKLLDLVKSRKGGQTALIVYAATAFTVTPLTDDDNTIANLVPSLEPALMPAQGSNTTAALERAGELLQQAGITSGDVLLVTDGVGESAMDAIDDLAGNGHRLSILGIGTTEGGPIPLSGGFQTDASGAIVISRLKPPQLQQAAHRGGGRFVAMRADDSDIDQLTELFSRERIRTETESTDLKADIWQEEGPWLLLLVIPLVAMWPRKGWLLCLMLFTLPVPQPAQAADLSGLWPEARENLWLRPDQRAMKAFNAGDAGEAAVLFDDTDWKAAAHYRAGNYARSNELLTSPESSTDYYNKGNVLARLGNFKEAIEAYDQAIGMDPENEDARFNRDLVKQALKQQQQQQSSQQQDPSQDQSSEQKQDDQQQSQDQSQQQQAEQQGDQSQQNQQPGDKQQDAADQQDQLSDIREKQDQESLDHQDQQQPDVQQADEQQQTEEPLQGQQQHEAVAQEDAEAVEDEQAMEQWLRRIPDDPGGLMRRKFIYQYRRMPRKAEVTEPW